MSLSNYMENVVLDHLFGKTVPPEAWPASLWVALCTANPTDAGTGIACWEIPSAWGYARVATYSTTWNFWEDAAAGGIKNAEVISFPKAVGGDWGLVTHFALLDDAVGGNMIAYGELAAEMNVTAGSIPKFGPWGLTVLFASIVGFSRYVQHKILDYAFGKIDEFPYAPLHVALCTDDPTPAGTGSDCNEIPSWYGYERVSTVDSDWTAESNGLVTNSGHVTFARATGYWGVARYFALIDLFQYGFGNMLMYGKLAIDVVVTAGKVCTFSPTHLRTILD